MRLSTALLALAIVAGGLFLRTARCHPERLRELGIDWLGLADLGDAAREQQRYGKEIDRALAVTQERIRLRREIARDLLAGRLDLFTAAAEFRSLNQQCPATERTLANLHPDIAPDELACRYLLMWIKEDTRRTPAWPAYRAMLLRLEGQLEHHLRVYGEVKLPGPTDSHRRRRENPGPDGETEWSRS